MHRRVQDAHGEGACFKSLERAEELKVNRIREIRGCLGPFPGEEQVEEEDKIERTAP